jgi:hypothetical protein
MTAEPLCSSWCWGCWDSGHDVVESLDSAPLVKKCHLISVCHMRNKMQCRHYTCEHLTQIHRIQLIVK